MHKAKGLEFDNVIVFDAADGRYPNAFNKNKKQDEEDARKFYVAMSRAKRRLYIAYSLQMIDRYGRVHNRGIDTLYGCNTETLQWVKRFLSKRY